METPIEETWDVEERGAREGGRKGSGAQGGLYVYCSLGCRGGTGIRGEAVQGEPRWRETLQVQRRGGGGGSRALARWAERDADVGVHLLPQDCLQGRKGVGGVEKFGGGMVGTRSRRSSCLIIYLSLRSGKNSKAAVLIYWHTKH